MTLPAPENHGSEPSRVEVPADGRGADAGSIPSSRPSDGYYKPVHEWFSFEGRCLVCGERYARIDAFHGGRFHSRHLLAHCRERVLQRKGLDFMQVKAHHVGFPGILLPKEMQWSR